MFEKLGFHSQTSLGNAELNKVKWIKKKKRNKIVILSNKLMSIENVQRRSSCHGSVVTNLTNIHDAVGLIPGLAQWVKDAAPP